MDEGEELALSKLNKSVLERMARDRGLSAEGSKVQIVSRLEDFAFRTGRPSSVLVPNALSPLTKGQLTALAVAHGIVGAEGVKVEEWKAKAKKEMVAELEEAEVDAMKSVVAEYGDRVAKAPGTAFVTHAPNFGGFPTFGSVVTFVKNTMCEEERTLLRLAGEIGWQGVPNSGKRGEQKREALRRTRGTGDALVRSVSWQVYQASFPPMLPVLPDELLVEIFRYLSLGDLVVLGRTSKTLRRVSRDNTLWAPFADRVADLVWDRHSVRVDLKVLSRATPGNFADSVSEAVAAAEISRSTTTPNSKVADVLRALKDRGILALPLWAPDYTLSPGDLYIPGDAEYDPSVRTKTSRPLDVLVDHPSARIVFPKLCTRIDEYLFGSLAWHGFTLDLKRLLADEEWTTVKEKATQILSSPPHSRVASEIEHLLSDKHIDGRAQLTRAFASNPASLPQAVERLLEREARVLALASLTITLDTPETAIQKSLKRLIQYPGLDADVVANVFFNDQQEGEESEGRVVSGEEVLETWAAEKYIDISDPKSLEEVEQEIKEELEAEAGESTKWEEAYSAKCLEINSSLSAAQRKTALHKAARKMGVHIRSDSSLAASFITGVMSKCPHHVCAILDGISRLFDHGGHVCFSECHEDLRAELINQMSQSYTFYDWGDACDEAFEDAVSCFTDREERYYGGYGHGGGGGGECYNCGEYGHYARDCWF